MRACVRRFAAGLFLTSVTVLTPAADAAETRLDAVPLILNPAPGVQPPPGWPVTTGVPFKDGDLSPDRLASLRVETDAGRAVPAQFEIRGSYPRSKAVRWLGVDFALDPAAKHHRLVIRGGGPAHPKPVGIRTEGNGLVVTSGDLRAEMKPAGCGLLRVWLKDRLVLEQTPADGNHFTLLDGARYSDANDREVKVSVEREGPLHGTVRVDARYLDAKGTPACRWTIRYHCRAGMPGIQR